MRKILIFSDWFVPGFKGGGPIRSCINFAEFMKSEYQIYVITRDRDFGDELPYQNVKVNEWVEIREAIHVNYLSPKKQKFNNISNIIIKL